MAAPINNRNTGRRVAKFGLRTIFGFLEDFFATGNNFFKRNQPLWVGSINAQPWNLAGRTILIVLVHTACLASRAFLLTGRILFSIFREEGRRP